MENPPSGSTTDLLQSTPVHQARPGSTPGEFRHASAFAALKTDGSVLTWGDPFPGGDSSAVASALGSGVSQIFSSLAAFAALKADGSVVTWGDPASGGDSSAVGSVLGSGVSQIFSSVAAFAALKTDGSVVTWGDPLYGGDSSGLGSALSSGVTRIFSTDTAFAALRSDGSLITWGGSADGGDSSAVALALASGISDVMSTFRAFAALGPGGSVITWGEPFSGGDSTGVADALASGVVRIFATDLAFAALKADGSVVTWGGSSAGADSSSVATALESGVVEVYSTSRAFAARKLDGSVVAWGNSLRGGDSSAVQTSLADGVVEIFSTGSAFAALKGDGSVVTWGNPLFGGDSSAVAADLTAGVSRIFANVSAFAALKTDGSVVTWGASDSGGDSSAVATDLAAGVTQIFTTGVAFAALKADGSVVTWGDPQYGGDSSAVAGNLAGGVVAFANPFTDDRLTFPPPPPPEISLSVAPQEIVEDSGTSFTFTFTRTGATSDALEVFYSLGGSATGGEDFDGIPPQESLRTVVFPVGSSVVTVSVQPLADFSEESDETIVLTLLPGTGYTLAPTDSAIATISNDDSYTTVEADGTVSLLSRRTDGMTFVQTGSSTQSVTFQDVLVETGSSRIDRQILAAEKIGGSNQILLRSNPWNLLQVWNMDASWRWLSSGALISPTSPDAWNLEVSFALDLNGDGVLGAAYITIENMGEVILLGTADGRPFVKVGDTIRAITSPWNARVGDASSEWQMLAAERTDGRNGILWRNNSANNLSVWNCDTNWSWQSSRLYANPSPEDRWNLEIGFQIDLDGDGSLGAVYSTIESKGNVTLLSRGDGQAFVQIGSDILPVILQGSTVPTGTAGSEWQMLAAETLSGGNRILWRNNIRDFLQVWSLNSGWGWQTSGGTISPTSREAWSLETDFQIDLDGDGSLGAVFTTIEEKGNVTLLSSADGQAFVKLGTDTSPVTLQGSFVPVASATREWQMLAAETLSGGNRILWRNNIWNALQVWSLNSTWDWTSSGKLITPTSPETYSLETDFQLDINGDGLVGDVYITLENKGNVSLLRRPTGQAFVQADAAILPITLLGSPVANTPEWQMLAAEKVGVTNRILWRNNVTGNFTFWNLDSKWAWQSSRSDISPSSAEVLSLETSFQIDLDGDGKLGATYIPIERKGTVSLLKTSNGNGFVEIDNNIQLITSPWNVGVGDASTPWEMLAAETLNGGNRILWRNNPNQFYSLWNLDASWSWQSSEGMIPLSSPAALDLETTFGIDLNGDGNQGPPLPVINLSVAPFAVLEDGETNLTFIFTRNVTTAPLTVSYSISGSADGLDYSGATPGTARTITFAAGSATAELTLVPTPDSSVEVDETVVLTLSRSNAYTLAAVGTVTATILNDDKAAPVELPNDASTPAVLNSTAAVLSSEIDTQNDEDWIRIDMKQGRYYFVTASAEGLYPDVDVVSADQEVILPTRFAGPDTSQSTMGFWLQGASSPLFARMRMQDGFVGPYTINLQDLGTVAEITNQIYQLTNEARDANGLDTLTGQPLLDQAAQGHTDDMVKSGGFLSNIGSDGSSLEVRLDRIGYAFSVARENAASGQYTPAEVVQDWLAGVARENLFAEDVSQLGVGFSVNLQTGETYWTQVLASIQ